MVFIYDDAQFTLGRLYFSGYGDIEANPEYAIYWLSKAANQRNIEATYKLAVIYLSGKLVPRNLEYGVSLLRRLTEKEYPYTSALYVLGLCYENGWGVLLDIQQSIKLFKRAMSEIGGHAESEIEYDKIIRIHNITEDVQVTRNEIPIIPKHENIGIYSDDGIHAWQTHKTDLDKLYTQRIAEISKHGYGIYARHHMFTVGASGELVPVQYPDPISLEQMVGYERERGIVVENTKALLAGK